MVAAGGKEARLFAEQFKGTIHLLLTYVVMPGMNGRELSEELVTLRPAMKVLYMSGYPDDAVGAPWLDGGEYGVPPEAFHRGVPASQGA